LILPGLVLSLLGITAAGAYPTPRTEQATPNELLVEVGHKGVKATSTVTSMATLNKYGEKYHYGNRYWTHRYRYRPIGWQLYGCVAAGPFWYCPYYWCHGARLTPAPIADK
jgi:hypothetical protein